MNIQEGKIITPYGIPLNAIEENRNAEFEDFIQGCQIVPEAGEDLLEDKVLLVAIHWNCGIKFKGFYLPVIVRVYTHDHIMQFVDKKDDFAPIVGAVRNSFSRMKEIWKKQTSGSAIENMIKAADEAALVKIANDILAKAEFLGYYD